MERAASSSSSSKRKVGKSSTKLDFLSIFAAAEDVVQPFCGSSCFSIMVFFETDRQTQDEDLLFFRSSKPMLPLSLLAPPMHFRATFFLFGSKTRRRTKVSRVMSH